MDDMFVREWLDTIPHIQDDLENGAFIMAELQVGTDVIRKVDARDAVPAFGVIEHIVRGRATVRWFDNGRQQHSTLALASLVEVTPELSADVRARAKARREAYQAKLDAERIYLCTNVNPQARVSNDGHPKPLPLAPGQTVNMEGKFCLYCGAPVILREQQGASK